MTDLPKHLNKTVDCFRTVSTNSKRLTTNARALLFYGGGYQLVNTLRQQRPVQPLMVGEILRRFAGREAPGRAVHEFPDDMLFHEGELKCHEHVMDYYEIAHTPEMVARLVLAIDSPLARWREQGTVEQARIAAIVAREAA